METQSPKLQYLWQSIVFLAIGYTAYETPITYAFHIKLHDWQLWVDGLISIIFFADIVVHLKQGSILPSSEDNPYATKSHTPYKKSGWFIIDIVATIPYDIIISAMGIGSAFAIIRLVRLVRLLRIIKLFEMLDSFAEFPKKFKVGFILCMVAIFLHWIACGWMIITPADPALDAVTVYNRAMYWTITTLTTIGYGDITPVSNIGRIFTMIIMITGVGLYGVVIGNFSRMLLEADRHKQASKERIHDLSLFMKHYRVPSHIQRQVFSFYKHLLDKRMSENDTQIIADLPKALQSELQIFMNVKLINDIPFFSHAPNECLKMIAQRLQQTVYSPGDFIMKKGDKGAEMFIIGHGMVDIIGDNDQIVATLKDGQFFGEISLLKETNRTADVRAKSYCDLYKLEKDDFLEVIERFPELAERVYETMSKRQTDQKKSA